MLKIESYNSNHPDIGYNMTSRYMFNEKYFKDKNVICDIINDIRNTEMSLMEIGNKYGVSTSIISSINSGRSYKLTNVSYPIRIINMSKKLNKKTVISIVNLIYESKLTFDSIGKIYNIDRKVIGDINNGRTYTTYTKHIVKEYPIRAYNNNETDLKYIEEVLYKELINPKNKTIKEISIKTGLSESIVTSVNLGKTHSWHLRKKYPDIKYPIKEIKQERDIEDDITLIKIIELLKYTTLTMSNICTIILKQDNYDLKNTLYRINSGIRYGKRVQTLIPNLEFPIRPQSKKKRVFASVLELQKEKDIFKKYDVYSLKLPFKLP